MEKAKRYSIGKKDLVISGVIVLVAAFQVILVLQNAGLMEY
jgi:hypothetical protein